MIKLLKTGVEGLDILLGGGIPETNQVLLVGGPGTGKTLLSFEILLRNAMNGNRSVFFALEEDPKRVIINAKAAFSNLENNIDDLIKKNIMVVTGSEISSMLGVTSEGSNYDFGKIVSEIEGIINSYKANLVAIDSLSSLRMILKTGINYRKSILSLLGGFRDMGVTSIYILEENIEDNIQFVTTPDAFLFDGFIAMKRRETYEGEEGRAILTIEIIKMRGNKHSFYAAPYEITPDGFSILTAGPE